MCFKWKAFCIMRMIIDCSVISFVLCSFTIQRQSFEYQASSTRSWVFLKMEIFPPYLKKSASTRSISNCICGRMSLEHWHEVIIFENLSFRPSTWIWWISGECIWRKKSPFSKIPGYVRVDGCFSHAYNKWTMNSKSLPWLGQLNVLHILINL